MGRIPKASVWAVLAAGATMAAAQRPAYQPANPAAAKQGSGGTAAPAPVKAIYVDQECRLMPDPATLKPGEKIRRHRDATICHLEAVFDTHHRQETAVGNELERADVEVYEQQYVLQNIYTEPVAFMVEQPVDRGWTLESDPPPIRVVRNMATFRAMAQPGEIVRLHVGMRYTQALKPKVLKSGARGPAAPAPQGPPTAGQYPTGTAETAPPFPAGSPQM